MIIISGASRGIGKYLYDKYMDEGIECLGIRKEAIPLKDYPCGVSSVDISEYSEIEKWVNSKKDYLSNIVLINCAGINYSAKLSQSNNLKWENVIRVNVIGTYNLIKCLLPIMEENKWGRIVCFSSVVAQRGVKGTSAYSASKAALWGLVKSIATEYGNKGITANCLNLGYFNIGMINEVPLKIQEEIKKNIPCNEFGDPKNIYSAINFLIEAEYVNGTTIDINGGLI